MVAIIGGAVLVGAFAAFRWLRTRFLIAAVRGPSMLPTYHDGDRLIAHRRSTPPLRGDVVVFRNPHRSGVPGSSQGPLLIKRVVSEPGDPAPAGMDVTVVPEGHVAVLGDNSEQSLDSRQLGFIPLRNVVATVVRKLGA